MYDVFISYRREGGFAMAKLLQKELEDRGIRVFLDVDELKSGPFNTKLYESIDESKNFVPILSPHALDRCINDGDWVRLEIERAFQKGKNIAPVTLTGFTYPELPESLKDFPTYNSVMISTDYFKASIDKLIGMLVDVTPAPKKTGEENGSSVIPNRPILLENMMLDKIYEKATFNFLNKYTSDYVEVIKSLAQDIVNYSKINFRVFTRMETLNENNYEVPYNEDYEVYCEGSESFDSEAIPEYYAIAEPLNKCRRGWSYEKFDEHMDGFLFNIQLRLHSAVYNRIFSGEETDLNEDYNASEYDGFFGEADTLLGK